MNCEEYLYSCWLQQWFSINSRCNFPRLITSLPQILSPAPYMSTYVYIYIYICMCIYIYIHQYQIKHTYLHRIMYFTLYLHTNMFIYIDMLLYSTHIYTYIYIYSCTVLWYIHIAMNKITLWCSCHAVVFEASSCASLMPSILNDIDALYHIYTIYTYILFVNIYIYIYMWQGPLGSISFRPTSMYCICIYTKI